MKGNNMFGVTVPNKWIGRLRKSKAGFSLIEISIVLIIIGLLAGMTIGGLAYVRQARYTNTDSILKNVKIAIDSFQLHTGMLPASLNDLLERPSNEKISKKWQGPYLDKEPHDAWNNELIYRPTKGGKHPYELYSWGPNGEAAPEEEWRDAWTV
jgi:general secretion pathway protein G